MFKHHAFYICTELCIFDVIYYLVFFMSLIGLIYFHGMPDNIIFTEFPVSGNYCDSYDTIQYIRYMTVSKGNTSLPSTRKLHPVCRPGARFVCLVGKN